MDYKLLNGLTLAYIGDSVYEIYIRKYVVSLGKTKVNKLHKETVKFTSGKNQAKILHYLINNNLLTDEELLYYKRGRNSHVNTTRKNIELKDYLDATGFEAMFGYLSLSNQVERIEELIDIIIKVRGEICD